MNAEKRNEASNAVKLLDRDIDVELTARQQLFCEEYIKTKFKSATKAAIAAGYKGRHPHVAACTILKNPKVVKYLNIRKKLMLQDAGVSTFRMLQELAWIAFADIRQVYKDDGTLKNISELPEEVAAAIDGLETEEIFDLKTGALLGYGKKVKMNSKLRALELLMRFKGLLEKTKEGNQINFNNFNVSLDLGNGTVLKLPVNGEE